MNQGTRGLPSSPSPGWESLPERWAGDAVAQSPLPQRARGPFYTHSYTRACTHTHVHVSNSTRMPHPGGLEEAWSAGGFWQPLEGFGPSPSPCLA